MTAWTNTGYEVTEDQIGAVQPEQVRPAQQFYISAESIRVRTSPDTSSNENIAGRLSVNDKVEVLDATPIGKDQFVKIRVVSTTASLSSADELYVSSKFFNAEPIKIVPAATSLQAPNTAVEPKLKGQTVQPRANRLFVVTNIATEKMRVYERCLPNEGCVNRMILETDVVNGEDDDGTRTHVGFYQVQYWVKFYEVYSGSRKTYPAWYKPGYPPVPDCRPLAGQGRRSSQAAG